MDAADPGGATKYGITLRAAQDFWGKDKVTVQFIRDLTLEDARAFYLAKWSRNFDHIEKTTPATKVFDAAINMGGNGIKCAQRAVNALGGPPCDVDGVLGPNTVQAINNAPEADFLRSMGDEMTAFYQDLAARKPVLQKFLKGWLNRAAWGVPA